jgi:hypothetical protein
MATLGSTNLTMIAASVTLSSTPLSISNGSSIYLCIAVGSSRQINAVSDNQGNTYVFVRRSTRAPITSEIWYTDAVIGVGTLASSNFIVTITASGSCDMSLKVCEIIGASNPSIGTSVGSTGTSSSSITLSGINTTVPVAFGLLSIASQNTGSVTFTAISPSFIIRATPAPSPISPAQIADSSVGRQFTATGNYSMGVNIVGTSSSLRWAAVAVWIRVTCGCNFGCDGVSGSTSIRDCAGACHNPNVPPLNSPDCAGVCNGPSVKDCAGTCYNPNISAPPQTRGCDGVCGSGKIFDCNGVCGGSSYRDCGDNCINPLVCSTRGHLSSPSYASPVLFSMMLIFVMIIIFSSKPRRTGKN